MALQTILVKNGTGYDISGLVQKAVWAGRKSSPARSLQLTILDDPTLGENNRVNVDVYSGNHIIFSEDGEELFRGIIMRQQRTQARTLTLTCYDSAIYLANNKDSYKYKKKTLTDIFNDICKRFGIPRGETANVPYKLPNIVVVNSSIYDLLCMAMSQTYYATGERYYIISKKGQLHLVQRLEQVTKLVLETGEEGSAYGNLTAYSYSKDIGDVKTRLKLITQKGKTKAEWKDTDLESKIGVMQEVDTPDDTIKKKKLKTMVITMLDELKQADESLDVTAVGISSIYSGIAVYIYIPEIGMSRTMYVDADTHTWDGGYHSMKLTLNFAKNLESINDAGEVEKTKAEEAAADAAALAMIKEAKAKLKEKKAAESKVIKASREAEKAYKAALKAFKKGDTATVATQADAAESAYKSAKEALAEVKQLLGASQSSVTSTADKAAQSAETYAYKARRLAEGYDPDTAQIDS